MWSPNCILYLLLRYFILSHPVVLHAGTGSCRTCPMCFLLCTRCSRKTIL